MSRAAMLALACAASCSGGAGPRPTAAPSPTALVETESTAFVSPSRNIGCELSDEYVECAVKERTWQVPDGERCAEYAGFEHFDGGVHFTCLGAEMFAEPRVLAYGTSLQVGILRCESARAGITCRAVPTGRGFTLSRGAYRVHP